LNTPDPVQRLCPDCLAEAYEREAAALVKGYDRTQEHDFPEVLAALRRAEGPQHCRADVIGRVGEGPCVFCRRGRPARKEDR
jgi:hypothetical protein